MKEFTAFREEDIKNCGFTPSVERCTARANEAGKQLFKQFADRVSALVPKAESILTSPGFGADGEVEHLPAGLGGMGRVWDRHGDRSRFSGGNFSGRGAEAG